MQNDALNTIARCMKSAFTAAVGNSFVCSCLIDRCSESVCAVQKSVLFLYW